VDSRTLPARTRAQGRGRRPRGDPHLRQRCAGGGLTHRRAHVRGSPARGQAPSGRVSPPSLRLGRVRRSPLRGSRSARSRRCAPRPRRR